MVNILYALNDVFRNGGTEAMVLSFYNNIDKSNFHIDFLVHGSQEENISNFTHNYLLSCGSKIFYVTPRGISYKRNKQDIRNLLKHNHFDIVHSHMDSAGMFFLKEAKKAGISVRIAHSHNTNDQINKGNIVKNLLYKFILKYARQKLNKYATERIACSELAGKWLFGKHSFVVLKNSVNLDKFRYNEAVRNDYRERLGINDKFVIGHVGRFSEQKNHKFLIDIFNEFLKINSNAVLLLIGEGELKDGIRQIVNYYKIQNRVVFMGNRTDVNNVLQAMDVFLMPSKFEGLSVVLVEAQTSGLPCLVSKNMAKEAFVTANCIPYDLGKTSREWAECLAKIAKQSNSREKAYLFVREKGYDIHDTIKVLEEIYCQSVK